MTCMPAAVREVAGPRAGPRTNAGSRALPGRGRGSPRNSPSILPAHPHCRQPAADEEGEGRKSINMQLALR